MNKIELFDKFKKDLVEMAHMGAAAAVLSWDQEVFMPAKGIDLRAETIANLAGIFHNRFVSKDFEKTILSVKELFEKGELSDDESCIFREIWRDFEREKKIPVEFVRELSQACSKAQNVWAKARQESDFGIFLPYLKNIVELKRKEAQIVGFDKNPYDALLDVYEPHMTTEELAVIFQDLKNFLIPFLKRIQESSVEIDPEILKGSFSQERQLEFNKLVAEKIGFDFEAGRLDVSTHPFTTSFNPLDVRITTRFKEDDIMYSLMSTIHEAGHALYEQGLLSQNFGTPPGQAISLGIHESQSRVWENVVGRGMPFWKYFYPKLQDKFPQPFAKTGIDDFHRALNIVRPSLIRTEADEVTYNLHVIMRFEIEKELLDGSIEVEDLPKIWNAKIKEYFDIEVPNDAVGVLQDVHWSMGSIGYFPTYALGNLYSVQFYEAAKRDIENLEEKFSRGEFGQFRNWLKKNIHIHGRLYSAEQLAINVTGERLNSKHYIEYIRSKYSGIYGLA